MHQLEELLKPLGSSPPGAEHSEALPALESLCLWMEQEPLAPGEQRTAWQREVQARPTLEQGETQTLCFALGPN